MLVIAVVVLGILVALVRGGRPRLDLAFRHAWLAPVGLAVQLASRYLPGTVPGFVLMIASYLALLYCLASNQQYQSLRLLSLGVALNFLVIVVNGGRMPVDVELARRIGVSGLTPVVEGTAGKHVAMSDATPFGFLGDMIPVPGPMPRLMSTGDIFILLGVFLLVQDLMGKRIQLNLGPGE